MIVISVLWSLGGAFILVALVSREFWLVRLALLVTGVLCWLGAINQREGFPQMAAVPPAATATATDSAVAEAKLYVDDGQGMMIVWRQWPPTDGLRQWMQDYPARADGLRAMTCYGNQGDCLVVVYSLDPSASSGHVAPSERAVPAGQ
ncbi:MAG: hypothetical protein HY461_01845 [Parcubacteria group bacterium]|nr:hypothetical protein [Parcubacteria group bacterium]